MSLVLKFSRKTAMDPRRESRTFVLSQGERRSAGEGSATDARAARSAAPGDRRDHGLGRHRLVEVRVRRPRWQLGARGVFRPTGARAPAQARAASSQICGRSRRVRGRASHSTAHRSFITRWTDVRTDLRRRDRQGERAPREVGETVHSMGPSGRASEGPGSGARPLDDQRAPYWQRFRTVISMRQTTSSRSFHPKIRQKMTVPSVLVASTRMVLLSSASAGTAQELPTSASGTKRWTPTSGLPRPSSYKTTVEVVALWK